MKKYRIIKITSYDGKIRYALEHRGLGFLWREKLEIDIDGYYTVYNTKEKAEEALQQYIGKDEIEIVGEY